MDTHHPAGLRVRESSVLYFKNYLKNEDILSFYPFVF